MSNSMSATLKYALVSHIKMELMAKLVRGKKVQDALDALQFLPKKSAKTLHKVIKSAVNNAVTIEKKDITVLYVQTIDV
jgi:large subunit ribosomal protein L22